MSINTKMTAIAEKIRSLLGITGTMGLDAMSTNLEIEQTNIASAFTAIGNKGGTVPETKTSGNLSAAIDSIPLGVTVQRKAGTFTPKSGKATVNCGFQPDVVFVKSDNFTDDDTTYMPSQAIVFSEETRNNPFTALYVDGGILEMFWTQTSNGFTVNVAAYDWDWNEDSGANSSRAYVAIKYT